MRDIPILKSPLRCEFLAVGKSCGDLFLPPTKAVFVLGGDLRQHLQMYRGKTMKRTILAALVAIFVFSTPVAVMAQDDEPETVEVVLVEEAAPTGPSYAELILWFAAVVGVWSAWSLGVSRAMIDKGIKPILNAVLSKFGGDDEINKAIRTVVIVVGIFVGSFFAVQEFGINIFEAAPDYVLMMIPNHDAQLFVNVVWLAAGVFLFHDFKNWLASDETEPQALREAA